MSPSVSSCETKAKTKEFCGVTLQSNVLRYILSHWVEKALQTVKSVSSVSFHCSFLFLAHAYVFFFVSNSLCCIFCLHISWFLSLLSHYKNTDTRAHSVHITQPHSIQLKVTQGPLKLGWFPNDVQYPKGFLEGCVFVCAVNEPTNLFLSLCIASCHTHNISRQTTTCKKGKEKKRNKDQSPGSKQRQYHIKKKVFCLGNISSWINADISRHLSFCEIFVQLWKQSQMIETIKIIARTLPVAIKCAIRPNVTNTLNTQGDAHTTVSTITQDTIPHCNIFSQLEHKIQRWSGLSCKDQKYFTRARVRNELPNLSASTPIG